MRAMFLPVAFLAAVSTPAALAGPFDDAMLAAEKAADACDATFRAETVDCYKKLVEILTNRVQQLTKTGGARPTGPTSTAAVQASSPEPGSPFPSSSAIVLTGGDLAVQTHKWDGKVVQSDFRCFYADVNEFRCVSGAVRVDFGKLGPAEARASLERNCDRANRIMAAPCKVTIQFIYAMFDVMETGGLGQQRIVVARNGTGHILTRPR